MDKKDFNKQSFDKKKYIPQAVAPIPMSNFVSAEKVETASRKGQAQAQDEEKESFIVDTHAHAIVMEPEEMEQELETENSLLYENQLVIQAAAVDEIIMQAATVDELEEDELESFNLKSHVKENNLDEPEQDQEQDQELEIDIVMQDMSLIQKSVQAANFTNAPLVEKVSQKVAMATVEFIKLCSSGKAKNVFDSLRDGRSKNVNINGVDDSGTPPLNYAVMLGHASVVKLLLYYGADPDVKDSKGRDAKRWASRSLNTFIREMIADPASVRALSLQEISLLDEPTNPKKFIPASKVISTPADSNPNSLTQKPTRKVSFNENVETKLIPHQSSVIQQTFDWNSGKVNEMCPFDPDDASHILTVAICTIVPKRKSKYQPLGANVLFLCARYAIYHSSLEIALIFLGGAIRMIRLWVLQNTNESYLQMYWLSNTLQLLVYLKRDGKMVAETIAVQYDISTLVQDIFEMIWRGIDAQLRRIVGPALVDWGSDDSKLEGDFFGFAKRTSHLRNDAVLKGSFDYQTFYTESAAASSSAFSSFVSANPQSPIATLLSATTSQENVSPTAMTDFFDSLNALCKSCEVHPFVVQALFSRIMAVISNLVFRRIITTRSLCSRSRAQQIKLNLSEITDWIHEHQDSFISVHELVEQLKPLTELLRFIQVISTVPRVSAFNSLLESFPSLGVQIVHQVMVKYRFEKGEQSFPQIVETYVQSIIDRMDLEPQVLFNRQSFTFEDSNKMEQEEEKDDSGREYNPAKILLFGEVPLPSKSDESFTWTIYPVIPKVVLEMIQAGGGG